MLKKLFLIVLALVLLVLPLAVRRLYFYQGQYEPGPVNRPNLDEIKAHAPQLEPFEDHYTTSTRGSILVDQAHSNRVDMAELSVLQARLSMRGQQLEPVHTSDELAGQLRHAKALIVISPGEDWTADEIQQVSEFVDKGGRLLLVTDPTRYGVAYDEWDAAYLDDDVDHLNDLAAQFGLIFRADYLYNTVENEGNFRNIRLTDFASHELTAGIDQVVFYAAHSLISDELALISTGGETLSSSSERSEDLVVAVLAADGAVLALGDLTFMAKPYNVEYDNDRLLANIADFLNNTERQFDLSDFPLFFDDQADLVYTGAPLLDSDLLQGGSDLQTLFADAGKELTLRDVEDKTQDTIFFGLYEAAEEVEPHLASAGVTLLITPTEILEEEEAPQVTATPVPSPAPSPTPTEPMTSTPEVTPTVEITVTPEVTVETELTITAEISPAAKNRVQIESVGEMVLTGTSMLLHQDDGARQVLLVLANTAQGLENAVERLTIGDLEGCVIHETERPTVTVLALCPTGEVEPGEGGGGWQKPEPKPQPEPDVPTPTPTVTSPLTDTGETITETVDIVTATVEPPEPTGEPEGSILVVALDKGEGRYDSMTSVDNYVSILEGYYEVTTWSVAQDGTLDSLEVLNHDLVIWSFGDFDGEEAIEEVSDALISAMLGEIPIIMSGAFLGDTEVEAVQRDIQVGDAAHPVTAGFGEEEVIGFEPSPSGVEYEISLLEETGEDDSIILFVRGPDSEEPGAPSIVVAEDEYTELRIALIGFPLYLLPEEAGARLVLNLAQWMLNP